MCHVKCLFEIIYFKILRNVSSFLSIIQILSKFQQHVRKKKHPPELTPIEQQTTPSPTL